MTVHGRLTITISLLTAYAGYTTTGSPKETFKAATSKYPLKSCPIYSKFVIRIRIDGCNAGSILSISKSFSYANAFAPGYLSLRGKESINVPRKRPVILGIIIDKTAQFNHRTKCDSQPRKFY